MDSLVTSVNACFFLAHKLLLSMRAGFQEVERRLGWNYDHQLVQRAKILQPTLTTHFDFMHIIFVSGMFNTRLHLLCKQFGLGRKLREFAALEWSFPARLQNKTSVGQAIDTALSKSEKFGCGASDGMTILLL